MRSYIAHQIGSWKILDLMCHGISPPSTPISKCWTNHTHQRRLSLALATSRARRDLITFTPATCTIAMAAARGVAAAASCSSSAIGTSWANGISKTADVDRAVTKSQAFLKKTVAIGARDVCQ